jgi:pimeloyl-ACP methyl ester carboxylesterase
MLQRAFVYVGLESNLLDVDDKTTMHCWTPKKWDANKQNIILIHGFGANAMWQWYPQVKPFTQSFNVYVPDLVFFGGSTTKSSERSDIFQAESLMKMLKRLGVNKISVIGTSYGGFVAYNLAYLYPDVVDKVVIASSGICAQAEDNIELLKHANMPKISDLLLPQSPAILRILTRLTVYKSPITIIPNFILNDFIQTLYVENRAQKVELLEGITVGRGCESPLPVINKDVLIVWGEHDQIFPVDKAFQLKRHLADQAELVVMKNTSHIPHIEKPQVFNTIVKDFLLNYKPSIP